MPRLYDQTVVFTATRSSSKVYVYDSSSLDMSVLCEMDPIKNVQQFVKKVKVKRGPL